ncbi:hypothetical protein V2S85_25905 [Novosphingobium resinovorum]|nr:hypothetical protein [Novosphingobium resinovorum]
MWGIFTAYLTPGPERGEIFATLHGELNTILRWVEHQESGRTTKGDRSKAGNTGVSVSVVAGARHHRGQHSLKVSI